MYNWVNCWMFFRKTILMFIKNIILIEEAMESENIAGFTRTCFLMIWGCVSYHRFGELIIEDGTMKRTDYIDILDHNLLDSVENIFGDAMILFTLQYDNAHDVQVIQWLAQSPGLNVIDAIWSTLQNKVMRDRPSTKFELV